jgi:hypothetical protein
MVSQKSDDGVSENKVNSKYSWTIEEIRKANKAK